MKKEKLAALLHSTDADVAWLKGVLGGAYGGPSLSVSEDGRLVLYRWRDAPVSIDELARGADLRELRTCWEQWQAEARQLRPWALQVLDVPGGEWRELLRYHHRSDALAHARDLREAYDGRRAAIKVRVRKDNK